jgi:SagB-type dehydrogenase family enzyme
MRPQAAPFVRAELYGDGEPALDDPAELFHEASKLHPALARRQAAGLARLAASEELRAATARAVRRNPELPLVPLPAPVELVCTLARALERRASGRELVGELDPVRLATLLDAGYGIRGDGRRTVPSAGALYPLELFVAVRAVARIPPGVYRFDAHEHALELHAAGDPWPALEAACPLEGLLENGAAALLVLGVFGRARCKYGQRGYRFTLLEAGHVAQNVVLAAAALGVPALPLGGFYDAQVDAVVDIDGVDESVVYAVVV